MTKSYAVIIGVIFNIKRQKIKKYIVLIAKCEFCIVQISDCDIIRTDRYIPMRRQNHG